jgi:CDP-glycerol glycerophosphotransferase (TagB/SpsB family)
MGLDVLEYFSRNQDYNLIVAPHVMLYKKKIHISLESRQFRFTKKIPSRFWKCSNIRIDPGSKSSVNMDYTMSADIYLGDVSSQVYEFLYRPRPCVFLNSHQADWSDNPDYRHWQCGPVLERVADLEAVLSDLEATRERFRDTQIKLFAETFDLNSTPSSQRAAQAIVSFLETQTPPASQH